MTPGTESGGRNARRPIQSNYNRAPKGSGIVGPALAIAAGVALAAWGTAHTPGNLPAIAIGTILALRAWYTLTWRRQMRQIAKRAERRRGYVR